MENLFWYIEKKKSAKLILFDWKMCIPLYSKISDISFDNKKMRYKWLTQIFVNSYKIKKDLLFTTPLYFSFLLPLKDFVRFGTRFYSELRFCNKLKFSNPYIFATLLCKPLLQTWSIWSNRLDSLKY